ncbi:hypothetical protein IDH50_11240 [Aeromicrobium tamlense]|uniref:Uncharacterized protein n=1 Tax=Aeromicrobium tamlense TaxID=375541 RepID=A0A8I0FW18_9ACTN|nr:hypothetical protein [Aeromicrobium tamlense]MBD1270808.1 hypothetical protein [Aeromicrobium tamlense]NYI38200.1 hypothetical protein [Aeromicrobium tamlense]
MYGQNTRVIREQLAILLRQRRIQHRIGGPGIPTLPVTTTSAERRLLGLQLGRYRHAVLIWALEAVRAVDPSPHIPLTDRRNRSAASELQIRLEEWARRSMRRPSIDELNCPQRYPILTAWQAAARAASLGEHDFGAGISFSSLRGDQVRTVLKDAATVTRALVVLDQRYGSIPGWHRLGHALRVDEAADHCIELAASCGTDPSVDLLGWRPRIQLIEGPAPSGLAGVLHAHHNLLATLNSIPDARDLRRIVASQLIVSRTLGGLAREDTPLYEESRDREQRYERLQRWTRDLYGQAGHGTPAVPHAFLAASRAKALAHEDLHDAQQLQRLLALSRQIDDRLGRIIEAGARERLFFERVPLPQIDSRSAALVKVQAAEYTPISSPAAAGLVAFARENFRGRNRGEGRQVPSQHSRAQLDAALRRQNCAGDGPVAAV